MSERFFKGAFRVRRTSMRRSDHWLEDLDTSDDVYVANTKDGVYVFYTEVEEAFIRTDTVVDVRKHR